MTYFQSKQNNMYFIIIIIQYDSHITITQLQKNKTNKAQNGSY